MAEYSEFLPKLGGCYNLESVTPGAFERLATRL